MLILMLTSDRWADATTNRWCGGEGRCDRDHLTPHSRTLQLMLPVTAPIGNVLLRVLHVCVHATYGMKYVRHHGGGRRRWMSMCEFRVRLAAKIVL